MKKTININLGGFPFLIDEDAFKLLNDYLDTIRYAFQTDEDTDELATDIENRIAELFIENDPEGRKIVNINEVSKVIERIGKPNEIIDIEEEISPLMNDDKINEEVKIEENITPPPVDPHVQYSRNPFARKKIFRDPQNAMLGGVCAGLAVYLNIDPIIIRLIIIILFFLSASTIAIAYIILWIVMPEASTPLQRMQMYGKDPTVENIGKTVTENFMDQNIGSVNNSSKNKSGFEGFISNIFSIFVKIMIILGILIGAPILLALLFVIIIFIIALFATGGALIGYGLFGDSINFSGPNGGTMVIYLILIAIGATITIGVPFYLLIRLAFKKNNNNLSQINRRLILILWFIGISLTAIFTVKSVKLSKHLDYDIFKSKIEKIDDIIIENKNVENLQFNEDGIIVKKKDGKTITLSDSGITISKNDENKSFEASEIKESSIQITSESDSIHSSASNSIK